MNKIRISTLLISVAFALCQAEYDMEDYVVIFEKNIFSETRTAKRADDSQQRQQADNQPVYVAEAFVLRGTVILHEEQIGFIENLFSGEVSHVHIGDDFDGSKVVAINWDGINLDKDGEVVEILIGRQFHGNGKVPAGAAMPTQIQPAIRIETAGDESEIIKRMMERRQQQLNR